jgi:hypothetical protein
MILAWADAYHTWWGTWPKKDEGRIAGTLGEKWVNVDMALRKGLRDLAGGSSLASWPTAVECATTWRSHRSTRK